ncbi:PREDICTED: peptide-N(4)-(N-acetyl-beta-glucosaminyl)asparagine amidase [Vollenhovia emeryi]|uniref:peptide-N(4)-(N-acetyl-beta- glucosaminyl)asparagine amidase n=1 Tax=Vollenhovia emeryi TaxID=411798 RepID=UPI0005F542DF|nr:PREDICTED: peptide-N(4)-(N-acetyl-beta-glucosaminyl)asparagine amidase [Vollenhovia emeryi]
MDESLECCVMSLEENAEDVRDEARRALLSICRNVLRSPDSCRSRELRLDDEVVVEKLLPAVGAMECLFDIGYVEDGERIFLPQDASLLKLQSLSRLLCGGKDVNLITDDIDKTSTTQKAFFNRVVSHFRGVMDYEDPELQRMAKRVVPVVQLEIATMEKIRDLQNSLKSGSATEASSQLEAELMAKDLFLVELLRWFKYRFFKWVNSPKCPTCGAECVYENVIRSTDPHCSRIELHRCQRCGIVVEFPRYTHPKPLLTLRRGRCGEWANVFTLLCRSLGYDARFVCDETDHVWTEIWSASNKRWIHVDPCENVVDKPLMYEKGWHKKLTYIIAYSRDEVQDVTWRYTRDQEAVMKRRKACSEQSLRHLLQSLTSQRQNAAGYSRARREYVVKRSLLELGDMLYIPNSQGTDSDEETYEARTSGCLLWRLARGEITNDDLGCYTWDISSYGQMFELRYNVVKDRYHAVRCDNGDILERTSGWKKRVRHSEGGIFRKVEDDWKMVYLARSSDTARGRVQWSFEVGKSKLCIGTFALKAKSEVFHGATVSWELEVTFHDDRTAVIDVPNCSNFRTEEARGAVRLSVVATLSGGEGREAWQHAQLFRQSLDNTEEPSMIINIQLKSCSRHRHGV